MEKYPHVWLRDNCQSPESFHPVSKARLTLMRDLDVDIVPAGVKLDGSGTKVRVKFRMVYSYLKL